MRKLSTVFLIVTASVSLLFAGVDVHINVNVGAPEIEFEEAPAVALVSPGIYIIPDYPEEVFFVSGFYWVIREGSWYRCAGPRQKWILVRSGRVPMVLVRFPRGRYRNWHPGKIREEHYEHERDNDQGNDHGNGHGHGRWK
jgi:hypothetical protein